MSELEIGELGFFLKTAYQANVLSVVNSMPVVGFESGRRFAPTVVHNLLLRLGPKRLNSRLQACIYDIHRAARIARSRQPDERCDAGDVVIRPCFQAVPAYRTRREQGNRRGQEPSATCLGSRTRPCGPGHRLRSSHRQGGHRRDLRGPCRPH